jgi:ABC-type antimicrobial peptide transport system permease subunit
MTLRGGREALTRLLLTALSVAVGVGLLLSVLAMYHAYQGDVAKPCWQCTHQSDANGPLLWNYSEDEYDGRTVERLDIAALAPGGPVVPGLSAMPAAGQFYASPALAALLRTVPANELADRFPGTLAGTIGAAGLQGPDDLAIVIGHPPSDLSGLGRTIRISTIQAAPRGLSTSQFYQFGFALGAVALLVPMLVLIGTATRMAAARREERYAAMRLVGAERAQINVVASVDAVIGAVIGAVAGIGVYAALRPLLVGVPLLGYRFYDASIAPAGWAYAGALVAVPAAAAVACLASLRRVQISPLGVSRRATPPAPRVVRVIPLLIGLAVFVIPVIAAPNASRGAPGPAMLALILVMVGMLIAGPWLTMAAARLLARWTRGGSGLLAARRMADNPRAAFRAVSGLMLAVMVGTALAALVPAAIASQDTSRTSVLSDVLRVGFIQGDRSKPGPDTVPGLTPGQAAPLLAALSAIPGATPIPLFHPTAADDNLPVVGWDRGGDSIVRCADAARLPALGTCPAGATSVLVDTSSMYTDNLRALDESLPFIKPDSPASTDDGSGQLVGDLVVKVDNATALERVRTVLSDYRGDIDPGESPMTFGEVAAVRAGLYLELQRVVTILAGVTLLIAGSGLAVAISGSLVERKRAFTLLRVSGTGVGTLYRAVLLETVLPLIAATVVAAGVGMIVAYPIARALAPERHAVVLPHPSFYLTLGGGLLVSLAIIAACLPILGRITATQNARFE